MNVLLCGASGFVGRHLRPELERAGHRVRTLGRSGADFDWSEASVRRALAECEAVIQLAGENLFARRWSARQKELLRSSRIQTTELLARELARAPAAAKAGTKGAARALISASAVGYYGPRGSEPVAETEPAGDDFLARLCRDWEAAAAPARAAGVRVAHLRLGLVLGTDGGALQRMLPIFRLGLGGPLGSGRQMHSWIHVDDLCALFRFALERDSCREAYNATAPGPVSQREFASVLGRVLGRPAFLPAPAFALRVALGEAAGVLLDGVRAVPARALAAGFSFTHPEVEGALRSLLARQ